MSAPRRARRALALALALGGAGSASACDGADAEADAGSTGAPPPQVDGLADAGADELGPLTIDRDAIVAYVLEWSWEGAAREEDAWVVVSDLGYTIGVEAAYVGTALVELVPCEDAAGADAGAGASAALALPEPAAQAAHSGTSDPSAAVGELVEAVHAAPSSVFGAGLASGDAYCGLHLLASPLDAAAADGARLDGESLRLRGWWSAPDDPARHALDASVNLPRGSVRALARLGARPPGDALAGVAAVFTVTRYPALAFDGVDLAALSDAELAYEVLANLVQSGEVEVAL
ncbi:MAG: hypothetical protein R3A79_07680 [Nannocystaceae bacterium]